MKNTLKRILVALLIAVMMAGMTVPALAAEGEGEPIPAEAALAQAEASTTNTKAVAAAITIAVAAGAGALAMAMAISKASDGIARQPEAQGSIRTTLMLGLVFIETAIIYALIVAILIVFVL